MNLKEVYEIFYPGNKRKLESVWLEQPKYRSKKLFFEELVPMEIRWLNSKIWNDKSRRSRFLSDSKIEAKYIVLLRKYLLEHPWTIPRIEKRADDMLEKMIEERSMNKVFFSVLRRENIELSAVLEDYLIDKQTGSLKSRWGNVLAFYFFLSIFPNEINQIYANYLYKSEHQTQYKEDGESEESKKDCALFQYEYPPDMSMVHPGEMLKHTWIMKNVGEIPWENRYYECVAPPFELSKDNRVIRIPETVYPGEMVSASVAFPVPDNPGIYSMTWKMKDRDGNIVYRDKLGLGLHFTVIEDDETEDVGGDAYHNYKILNEAPAIPATLVAGKLYSHEWTIQNTGTTVWRNYYLECINMESFRYAKSELRVPLKERIVPGEKISIKVEFVSPPVEGVYCMIWKIMKKDGKPAFPKERQLKILLNLI